MSPESHPHRPCVAFPIHPCLEVAVKPLLASAFPTDPLHANTSHYPTVNPGKPEPSSTLHSDTAPHRFPSVLRNNPIIVSPCKKPWQSLDSSLSLPSHLHSNHIQSLPLLTAWASPVFVPLHKLRLTHSSGFRLPT